MNILLADDRNWPMISEELVTAGVKSRGLVDSNYCLFVCFFLG
jgi:hypothetical protein